MEKDYLNFLVLFLVTTLFFSAGIRMKNNPERQVDRLINIIFSDNTFDKLYLFNTTKSKKKHDEKKTETLIKKEYLKNESDK